MDRRDAVLTWPDARRRVAHVSRGVMVILVRVQAFLEDVDGMWADGQYASGAVVARDAVLDALAVRGIATGGEPSWSPLSAAFDPFAAATPADAEEATTLVRTGARLAAERRPVDDAEVVAWRAALHDFVAGTEAGLGLSEPLPVLRSPDGMFSVFRLARGTFELIDEMGLPQVLPNDWSSTGSKADR